MEKIEKHDGKLSALGIHALRLSEYQNTKMRINKGTSVFIHSFAFHQVPEYLPDPENFDPETFNKTLVGRHPFAFLPFRECREFAMEIGRQSLAKLSNT